MAKVIVNVPDELLVGPDNQEIEFEAFLELLANQVIKKN